jgi:hypothetical protein
MFEAEINPTTTMLENVISNVVEIEDQSVVGTLDVMDDDSFDASSSFDLFFGQIGKNLDNMNNLNFDAMANLFEEPFQSHPYEPELSNFQLLLPTESHPGHSLALPLELKLPKSLPCLFDKSTVSEILWHTEEKERHIFFEKSWSLSHFTPGLLSESLFEKTAHGSPPHNVSSYVDFQIINYKKRKK